MHLAVRSSSTSQLTAYVTGSFPSLTYRSSQSFRHPQCLSQFSKAQRKNWKGSRVIQEREASHPVAKSPFCIDTKEY